MGGVYFYQFVIPSQSVDWRGNPLRLQGVLKFQEIATSAFGFLAMTAKMYGGFFMNPKPYGVNELREMFLSYFESKEHLRLPSFSLIPQNDKSLLLINSGMAPMKPYFKGEVEPPRRRVCTCQKCIRTGDIECYLTVFCGLGMWKELSWMVLYLIWQK